MIERYKKHKKGGLLKDRRPAEENPSAKKWNLSNEVYLSNRPSAMATPPSRMKTASVRLKFRSKGDYLVRHPSN